MVDSPDLLEAVALMRYMIRLDQNKDALKSKSKRAAAAKARAVAAAPKGVAAASTTTTSSRTTTPPLKQHRLSFRSAD